MKSDLERRPLLLVLAALVLGISVQELPWNLAFLLPLAWIARTMPLRLLTTCFFVLGIVLYAPVPQFPQPWAEAKVEGRVVSWETSPNSARLSTDYGPIVLRGVTAPFGTMIEATGSYYPPQPPYSAAIRVSDCRSLAPPSPLLEALAHLRANFRRYLANGLAPREADLAESISLGSITDLTTEERQNLNISGLAFLITSAGLHILIAFLLIQAGLGALPLPKWSQIGILVVISTTFIYLSGFQISVIRSALVALTLRSAYLLRREPDPLSAICLAGLLVLIFDPRNVFSLGFQLTMAASAILCLLYPRESGSRLVEPAFLGVVASGARFSLLGLLATAPILLQAGHSVAMESALTAPLGLFVLPPVIFLTFSSWLLGSWGIAILKFAVAPLIGWFEAVTDVSAGTTALHVQMPAFSGYWLVPFYAALLLLWRPRVQPA